MLYCHHPAVELYKHAFQITQGMTPEQNCSIALCFDLHTDRHRYLSPDAQVQEIAVLLPGDGNQPQNSQDIIVHCHAGSLMCIRDTHPLYPSLHFVLLHPTGQLGWHHFIPYEELEDQQRERKCKYMSMAEFNRFHLFLHCYARTLGTFLSALLRLDRLLYGYGIVRMWVAIPGTL